MKRYSSRTVIAIVVANMIGTGVFTSLGFQLEEFRDGFAIMALWVLGGVAAFCGALCYAELGAALPRSGGEYNFLREIYHPAAGFVSGWISVTVGFTAPVALAALTFSAYASSLLPWLTDPVHQKLAAGALIIGLALVHSGSHQRSAGLQNAFTLLKIGVILGFALLVVATPSQDASFVPSAASVEAMISPGFAIALIYVSYSYTGWNAATYLAGEMDQPQNALPTTLVLATIIVTALYVLLNAAFLLAAPADALSGQIEIGVIAAQHAFGEAAGRAAGGVLGLLLISTVSAMTVAGPRVLQVVGEDYGALRTLARRNEDGIPHVAVVVQSLGALLLIALADFRSILIFTGFTLALNSLVTVSALVRLRLKIPAVHRPFSVPLYPLPLLVYACLTVWTLVYVLLESPIEAWVSAGLIGSGLAVYALSQGASRGGSAL